MKTKEETATPYLRSELWKSIFDIVREMPRKEVDGDAMDHRSCTTEIEKVAQLYSDQQNRELREENQNQKEALSWADSELSRLNSENDTLRDNASENIKELATKDAEIQRLTKEVVALKAERDSWHVERDQVLEDSEKTITALTKEVEELKDHKRIAWESAQEHQKELTRLRELLVKSYPYLKDLYGAIQYQTLNELLTDIDNALNPKYNPPYIEGKTDLQNEG